MSCVHACLARRDCDVVLVCQVCDREGRARYAREALRPSGLPGHGGALDEAAGVLPEVEADQQPLGPVRTRRCLGIYHYVKAACEVDAGRSLNCSCGQAYICA